jgi:HEAT repeat protein
MDLSMERPDVEWYNVLPGRGPVYDLVTVAAAATDTGERLRAVAALGTSGDPRAVRPLVDLMSDTAPAIRGAAIVALGNLKSGRSVEALIGCLRDREEQYTLRHQAAAALAAIRSTGAIRELRSFIADTDEDAGLRALIQAGLDDLGSA